MRTRTTRIWTGLALGLLGALAAAEVVVRVAAPEPRVQVIRLDDPGLAHEEVDGVTLFWEPAVGPRVRGGPCAPGQVVVGLVGDSLEYVSGPSTDLPRVADALRDALRADGIDACVLDASWAAYKPDQELAALRRMHADTPLDVAVIGVWKPDARYARLGDLLIDGELVAHDADGVPLPPLPMPTPAHHALLRVSALWRYATLALVVPAQLPRPPDAAYRAALGWSRDAGVPLIALEGVPTDRPFDRSRRDRAEHPDSWQARLAADYRAAGAGWVWLADALDGLDVTEIRLDTCCHVDVRGHAAAGRALARPVAEALRAKVTTPGTDPPGTGSAPPPR